MNVREDGCGDKLFSYPVNPELVGDEPEDYEREAQKMAVLRVSFPTGSVEPEATARMLAGLATQQPISFEAIGSAQGIVHQVVCQLGQRAVVIDRLRSDLPGVAVEEIAPRTEPFFSFLDPLRQASRRPPYAFHDYYLPPPFFLPLVSGGSGTAGLYEVLQRVEAGEGCLAMWQVLLAPARRRWLEPARAYLSHEEATTRVSVATGNLVEVRRHPDLSDETIQAFKQGLKEKAAGKLFAVCLRACAFGDQGAERRLLQGLEGCVKGFHRGYDGQGMRSLDRDDYDAAGLGWPDQIHMLKNRVTFSSGMIVSATELAGLLPIPPRQVLEDATYSVEAARRTRPVPKRIKREGVRIGVNIHRGVSQPVLLPPEVRNRHVYVIGKTRMGKSSMMLNMIVQDMECGEGLSVLDPEGDLIEGALAHVPIGRLDDVVLFDVGDPEYAVAFNVLHGGGRSLARRRDDFIEIFEQTIVKLGDRMRMLLEEAISALLEVPGSNLMDVWPLMRDEAFRRVVLSQVRDPETRRYWLQEFPNSEKDLYPSIEALKPRLRYLVGDEIVRAVTCQREGRLDLPAVLRERKIFLVNLNFKAVGRDKGSFIGQILMSELQIAGMSRAIRERVDHYVYADEFQNYLCSAFELLLSQGAKYRTNLCLAHQYVGQSGDLVKAILGNVGARVIFQVGPADAQIFAGDLGIVTREELCSLPQLHAWVKSDEAVFSMVREAPPKPEHSPAAAATERSRQRYATRRGEISYDPPFMPGYWCQPVGAGEKERPGRGPIRIDESWDKL